MQTATLEITSQDATRFWAKVAKTDTCWLWTASKSKSGYGTFSVRGENRFAHRVSYLLHHGAIPGGLVIDHQCHVRDCVRPDHLRATTQKRNGENRKGANRNSASGVRGVCFVAAHNVWQAQLRHNGRQVYVGSFPTKEAASEAVAVARSEVFRLEENQN